VGGLPFTSLSRLGAGARSQEGQQIRPHDHPAATDLRARDLAVVSQLLDLILAA
jgi:hypothetical protein